MPTAEPRYGCPECRAVFRSGFARCPLDGTPLQELVDDPLAGSMFADRYVIEACIGEGGMGRVYRARHQRVSRKFAIKVLYGDHATDPKMRDRFAREAEAASRLDHPNVISVVDFGETEDGLLYLVMDFVQGRELAEVVHGSGALPAARVERILRHLCEGLRHAHGQGLIHRDFKGENVLLTGTGDDEVARIVDFGISFMLDAHDVQRLTTEGMVLGTPAYMSPEQSTGAELDHRTDLFSLGVLLYEMLAGVLPFEGPPLAVARQNLAVAPPAISERVPGLRVSQRLEAIAHRLMAKRPADRYQSAQEVLDALDAQPAAEQDAPIAFADTSPVHAGTRPRGRGPWIAAATVAAAGIAVAAWLALRGGNDAAPGTPPAAAAAADAAPTAAPMPAPATADAAVEVRHVAAPAPDAATRVAVRGRAPKPRTEPQQRDDVAKAPPSEPNDEPISTRDLTSRYRAVGEAIERVAAQQGEDVANPLRARYRKIPFADALRTPSLRKEVDATLRSLESRTNAALKK